MGVDIVFSLLLLFVLFSFIVVFFSSFDDYQLL